MTIYRITLDNYCGESNVEYYRNESNAIKRFQELRNEGLSVEEFEQMEPNFFSYFDANYNEYSTYITFDKLSLDDLFED